MRRGFALPLVLLVIVLVSLAAAVMLERSSSTLRRTAIQVGEYQDHHSARGIRTVINAWVRQYNATEMRELLDETGRALEITLADRTKVTVHLRDGQGSILAERGRLTDQEERDEALVLLDSLALTVPDQQRRALFTRDYGPMRVSILSAPREVLEAVAYLATEDLGLRDQWVGEILAERQSSGTIDSSAVTQITNRVFTDRGPRERLSTTTRRGLVTVQPTIWEALITVTPPPGDDRPVVRYQGAAELSAGGTGGLSPASPLATGESFLSWSRIELEGDERRWVLGEGP